ncbi:MAG: hypothetical protein JWP74_614 [Marmoricola sp.]|nr:hypothetical protein [Marmoricola sp.]
MERTLFLILALVGYLVGGVFAYIGGNTIAIVFVALASVPFLIWIVALGVSIGLRDALGHPTDEDATREAADRWLRERYGTGAARVTYSGTPEPPR